MLLHVYYNQSNFHNEPTNAANKQTNKRILRNPLYPVSHVIAKVSKPARLVAAGCLVFLVYLLYNYHNLPEEGGEGGGQGVKPEQEEEDSGVPVVPAKQVYSLLKLLKNINFFLLNR